MDNIYNDDWLLELAREIAANEAGPAVINQNAIKRMEYVRSILDEILTGDELKIESVFHKPFPSMGYISVIGKNVIVLDNVRFAEAVGLSSNAEIFPRVDGTAQMNFAFDGLTRKGR